MYLLALLESTVPSFPPPLRTFFVIFFISLVGAVGCNTAFHLIDQGKVGYLYHRQILFFNLHDASPPNNVSSLLYILWLNLRQYNNNDHTHNAIMVCEKNNNPPII